MAALKDSTIAGSLIIGGSLSFSGASRTVNLNTGVTSLLLPGGLDLATVAVNTLIGRAASGVLAALTALPAVSGTLVTALNATQLTSGTMPDGRFPVLLPTACKVDAANITAGTLPDARLPDPLPAISGTALISLNATQLTSGTMPDGRFPALLPAACKVNAENITTGILPDAQFPLSLPVVNGGNLTGLNASALFSGTIPDDRFPSSLPSTVGVNASTNLVSGFIPDGRFPATLPAVSGVNLTGITTAQIGGLATGVATFLATPSSANFRTMITDESGTGAILCAGGALSTPSGGTLTNCTGLPVATGISGLASGVAAFLATPSSANFRTMITDESGTGAILCAGGALGTPASGTLTNCTIPNLTGHITSVGNATSLGSFTLAQLSTAVSNANIARTDAAQTITGQQDIASIYVTGAASYTSTVSTSISSLGSVGIFSDGGDVTISSTGATRVGSDSEATLNTTSFGIFITESTGQIVITGYVPELQLGHSSDTTITRASAGLIAVEGVEQVNVSAPQTLTNKAIIPVQNSQSASYTLVIGDADKDILHPAASGAGDVFTIPDNASVAFAIGTRVRFINRDTTNAVSIAINTDTLTLSPGGTAGTRTLAAYGIATAIKITSTEWMISGTGLT